MAKLGVRKDHQQNQERMLKKVDEPPKYEGPKEEMQMKIAGHLGYNGSTSTTSPLSLCMNSADKCGYPLCKIDSGKIEKLMECSGCRSTKYCCRECQLSHWR